MPIRVDEKSKPDALSRFVAALDDRDPTSTLVVALDEHEVACSPSVADAVLAVLNYFDAGMTVRVVGIEQEIGTGQAAELLGVTRPTLVALVDSGQIPATRPGRHRRLRTADVLAFKEARRSHRSSVLDELASTSQDLGMYDRND